MKFSDNIEGLQSSATMSFFALMKDEMNKGVDVVSLLAGELEHNSPESAKIAGIESIQNNLTRYTVNHGIKELREAIAQKLTEDLSFTYNSNEVLISNGAKHALFNAMFALIGKDDEVLFFAPYYPSYPAMIKMCGGVPIKVDVDPGNFHPDIEDIKRRLNRKTKAVIINSPNNPTGTVYRESFLKELGELACEYNFWIFSDEIYSKIVFKPSIHVSPVTAYPECSKQTVLINGFSKSFAMTGWRLGYAAGPQEVIEKAALVQSHVTNNASTISQYAALGALKDKDRFIESVLPDLIENRKTILSHFNQLPDVDIYLGEGTYYALINIANLLENSSQCKNSLDVAIKLLKEYHVGLVPGEAFEAENFLRISYGLNQKSLTEGLKRLIEGLSSIA